MGLLESLDVYPKKARVSGWKRRVNKTINAGRRRTLLLDIEPRFDIDATRGICATRARVADGRRCRMIPHDRTVDQSHEYRGCNDFLARVVDLLVALL